MSFVVIISLTNTDLIWGTFKIVCLTWPFSYHRHPISIRQANWAVRQYSLNIAFSYSYLYVSVISLSLVYGHQIPHSAWTRSNGSLRCVLTVSCDFDVHWLVTLLSFDSGWPSVINIDHLRWWSSLISYIYFKLWNINTLTNRYTWYLKLLFSCIIHHTCTMNPRHSWTIVQEY